MPPPALKAQFALRVGQDDGGFALEAERIHVGLATEALVESLLAAPESTDAIVVHHREAKYFSV